METLHAQFFSQHHGLFLCRIAQRDDGHRTHRFRKCRMVVIVDERHQPFNTGREADAGRGRPAHDLHESIVSPAAKNGGLCAEQFGRELKYSVIIIIEPSHQFFVKGIMDAKGGEPFRNGGEEFFCRRGKIFLHAGGAADDPAVAFVFGIKDAQRVAIQAFPAVFRQCVFVPMEKRNQCIAVIGAAFGVTQGIEFQLHFIGKPECGKHLPGERDHLDIAQRFGDAEQFRVYLVELPHAAFLRPFVAEGRAGTEKFQRQLILQVVRYEGARNACGEFRPERQLLAAAIGEGIGFLGHDIRGVAQRAVENFAEFEYRSGDFPVAITLSHGKCLLGNEAEFAAVFREQIVRSAHGLEFL